eukprot:3647072-Amphidinium_carterae.1
MGNRDPLHQWHHSDRKAREDNAGHQEIEETDEELHGYPMEAKTPEQRRRSPSLMDRKYQRSPRRSPSRSNDRRRSPSPGRDRRQSQGRRSNSPRRSPGRSPQRSSLRSPRRDQSPGGRRSPRTQR